MSLLLHGDRGDPYSTLTRLRRRFKASGAADLLPAVAEDVADALRPRTWPSRYWGTAPQSS